MLMCDHQVYDEDQVGVDFVSDYAESMVQNLGARR